MAKLTSVPPIPPVSTLPIAEILDSMTNQQWWAKLAVGEQTRVKSETSSFVTALVAMGQSRLAAGEHLAAIQAVLEPLGVFTTFIHEYFHFSLRTAYRWIAEWKNAKKNLSEVILREAMAVGMNLMGESDEKPLGVYTEAVAASPPPKHPTPESARRWLVRIDEARRERAGGGGKGETMVTVPEVDRENLLRVTYIGLRRAIRRVSPGQRAEFVSQLVGMLVGEFGLKIGVRAVTVPGDWTRGRGRPRAA